MVLEVCALVILSSLSLLVVVVNASGDFGHESGPKGDNLHWFTYELNKLKSKSELNEVLFKPVLFFIFTYFIFFCYQNDKFIFSFNSVISYIPCRRRLLRNRTTKIPIL